MPKQVLGKEELERFARGARVPVPPNTIVTPLARDYAKEQGLTLLEGAEAVDVDPPPVASIDADAIEMSETDAVVAAVADEVVRSMFAGGGAGASSLAAPATPPARAPDAPALRSEDPVIGHRGVVTATGRNAPGILAELAGEIGRHDVDILDLSQTIVAGFFTMILVVDTRPLAAHGMTFSDFRDRLVTIAKERGFEATVVHERVLQSMQRI